MKKHVSFYLDKNLITVIDEYAENLNTTRSKVLSLILSQFFKEQKSELSFLQKKLNTILAEIKEIKEIKTTGKEEGGGVDAAKLENNLRQFVEEQINRVIAYLIKRKE